MHSRWFISPPSSRARASSRSRRTSRDPEIRVARHRIPDGATRREVAWALLSEILPGARLSNPCPACGGPHGPVRVHGADAVASVAYAGGFAVVATASDAEAIGIDAERDGVTFDLERVLGPTATVRDWVRTEAVLKVDGRGVRVDPALDIRTTSSRMTGRVADRSAEYAVQDVDGPPGLVISVAVSVN